MEHVRQTYEPSAPKSDSMIGDTGRLHDSLTEIRHRISKIADMLHGPVPTPAVNSASTTEPMPTVRRNIDHAFVAIDRIHAELTRIENRL